MIIECQHIEIKDEGNGKGKTIKVFGYAGLITTIEISSARLKGEWVEWLDERWGGTYLTCSLCRAEPLRDNHNKFVRSNFCPNCGTDMRGEKK